MNSVLQLQPQWGKGGPVTDQMQLHLGLTDWEGQAEGAGMILSPVIHSTSPEQALGQETAVAVIRRRCVRLGTGNPESNSTPAVPSAGTGLIKQPSTVKLARSR